MRLDYRVDIALGRATDASVRPRLRRRGAPLDHPGREARPRNGIEIYEQAIYKCVERGLSVFQEGHRRKGSQGIPLTPSTMSS